MHLWANLDTVNSGPTGKEWSDMIQVTTHCLYNQLAPWNGFDCGCFCAIHVEFFLPGHQEFRRDNIELQEVLRQAHFQSYGVPVITREILPWVVVCLWHFRILVTIHFASSPCIIVACGWHGSKSFPKFWCDLFRLLCLFFSLYSRQKLV